MNTLKERNKMKKNRKKIEKVKEKKRRVSI